jgi:hypothetical protein
MKTAVIAAGALLAGAWLSLASAGLPAGAQDDGPAENKPVLILGTGGSQPNLNDIAWVLTTDTYTDPKTKKPVQRKVLLCYRVDNNGKCADIVDVRDITWDVKARQLPVAGHNGNFTPAKMKKAWEDFLKKSGDESDD